MNKPLQSPDELVPEPESVADRLNSSDDVGRPTAEMLLTLPRFVVGEVMFGAPVPFKVKGDDDE